MVVIIQLAFRTPRLLANLVFAYLRCKQRRALEEISRRQDVMLVDSRRSRLAQLRFAASGFDAVVLATCFAMDEDMVPEGLEKRDGGGDSALIIFVEPQGYCSSLQINRNKSIILAHVEGASDHFKWHLDKCSCRPLTAPYWADVSEVKRLLHTSYVHHPVPTKRNAPSCFQGSCSVIAVMH